MKTVYYNGDKCWAVFFIILGLWTLWAAIAGLVPLAASLFLFWGLLLIIVSAMRRWDRKIPALFGVQFVSEDWKNNNDKVWKD